MFDAKLHFPADLPFPNMEDVIHAFIGGSELHGAKVDGTDDHDIYGVYIQPPLQVLGLDTNDHFVWSTASPERRNGPDDVDVIFYGLRKFANLAVSGNPTILHFLFTPNFVAHAENAAMWNRIVEQRQLFLASSHYKKYIGYAEAQLKKMTGERSRNVNRPELVTAYGFDTKFAMHVLRILFECKELLETGWITLPSPQKGLLIAVRKGEVTEDWVIREAKSLISACENLASACTCLPSEVNRSAVSELIADIYTAHWKFRGLIAE